MKIVSPDQLLVEIRNLPSSLEIDAFVYNQLVTMGNEINSYKGKPKFKRKKDPISGLVKLVPGLKVGMDFNEASTLIGKKYLEVYEEFKKYSFEQQLLDLT